MEVLVHVQQALSVVSADTPVSFPTAAFPGGGSSPVAGQAWPHPRTAGIPPGGFRAGGPALLPAKPGLILGRPAYRRVAITADLTETK